MPEMTRLFAEPELASLADDLVNDPGQRLWLLQRWGVQWELDADDPDGVAIQSILPQFFGDAAQPDALAAIRGWTAGLFGSLDRQDALIDSGALRQLQVPVSIIFGEKDRYLNPSLAAELSGLFKIPKHAGARHRGPARQLGHHRRDARRARLSTSLGRPARAQPSRLRRPAACRR
jgi:pimeloyl-ACP methyl ester carboxylesterase